MPSLTQRTSVASLASAQRLSCLRRSLQHYRKRIVRAMASLRTMPSPLGGGAGLHARIGEL
eukprot:10546373-Alexandrium_andersonii.AAC.1